MDKPVIYEYSHKGSRPTRRDSGPSSSDPKKPVSADVSTAAKVDQKGSQKMGSKGEIKPENSKPPDIKDSRIKTREPEKSGSNVTGAPFCDTPRNGFSIPLPKKPLPQLTEMDFDDDNMSTITVARAPVAKPSPSHTEIAGTQSTTKSKPLVSNTVINDCNSQKMKADVNGGDSKAINNPGNKSSVQADKSSVDMIRNALQKDPDWKERVTKSFKTFLESRNSKNSSRNVETNTNSTKVGSVVKKEKENDKVVKSEKSPTKQNGEPSKSETKSVEKSNGHKDTKDAKSRRKSTEDRTSHGSSKSPRHRQQSDSKHESRKESPKKSATILIDASSNHRHRQLSIKISPLKLSAELLSRETDRVINEKATVETDRRKRKSQSAEQPSLAKIRRKEESSKQLHDNSRKHYDNRSKKVRRDLKVVRIHKNLFEGDDEEGSQSKSKHKTKSENSDKHKNKASHKSNKDRRESSVSSKIHQKHSSEKRVGAADTSDLVNKPTSSVNVKSESSDRRLRSGKEKSTASSSKGSPDSKGSSSHSNKSKDADAIVTKSEHSSSKKTGKGHSKSSSVSSSHSSSKTVVSSQSKSSTASKTNISSSKLPNKMEQKDTKNLVSEMDSMKQKSAEQVAATQPERISPCETATVGLTPFEIHNELSKLISDQLNNENNIGSSNGNSATAFHRDSDDFPGGNDITTSDDELDIEALIPSLQPFTQGLNDCMSADIDELINGSYFDESDKNELGKYANPTGSYHSLNDVSISDLNSLCSNSTQQMTNDTGNQSSTTESHQDFPVLSIPDPAVPAVPHDSDESEEELPCIRIRTDLFTDPPEASSTDISPKTNSDLKNQPKENMSHNHQVPMASETVTLRNKSADSLKSVLNDAHAAGMKIQEKLTQALSTLKKHTDSMMYNEQMHYQSEPLLRLVKDVLEAGCKQIDEKLGLHSNNHMMYKVDHLISLGEMPLAVACNYFALQVLVDVLLVDYSCNDFITDLQAIRFRIMMILRVFCPHIANKDMSELWFRHANKRIQASLTSFQFEMWRPAALQSWSSLMSLQDNMDQSMPRQDHMTLGCTGFKKQIDEILNSIRRQLGHLRASISSETNSFVDIINTIFSTRQMACAQAPTIAAQEYTTLTGPPYLNNCSAVYSPVSVSPISPPNSAGYNIGTATVTTVPSMSVNQPLNKPNYSTTFTRGNMQQHNMMNPSGLVNQVMQMTGGNASMGANNSRDNYYPLNSLAATVSNHSATMNHPTQNSLAAHPGMNSYNPVNNGRNIDYNQYMQTQQHMPQQRVGTPQQRVSTPHGQPPMYSCVGNQNENVMYNMGNSGMMPPIHQHNQQARMQRISSVQSAAGGGQFQRPPSNQTYGTLNGGQHQSNYNAIQSLSSISENQNFTHMAAGNTVGGNLIHSSQQPLHTTTTDNNMISIENQGHYRNQPPADCQARGVSVGQPQMGMMVHGMQNVRPLVSRSLSMPAPNSHHQTNSLMEQSDSSLNHQTNNIMNEYYSQR